MKKNKKYFGRLNDEGNVIVLHMDGMVATRIDIDGMYPVDSQFSTRYEHPEGIILSLDDARRLGLTDDDNKLL